MACHSNDVAAVAAAIDDGASLNAQGSNGRGLQVQPLMASLQGGRNDRHAVLSLLLSRGADPSSAIMFAAGRGTPEVLRLLIQHGGNVNNSVGGLRPIFAALASRSRDTVRKVEVLLSVPELDLTTPSDDVPPRTPLELAVHCQAGAAAECIRTEVSTLSAVVVWALMLVVVWVPVSLWLKLGT